MRLLWGVIGPPSKTRFFEGSALPDHVVADFRKKVRFSPPAGHPPGEKTALFFEIRHQHSPTNREFPKIVFGGGGHLTPHSGPFRAPTVHTVGDLKPPRSPSNLCQSHTPWKRRAMGKSAAFTPFWCSGLGRKVTLATLRNFFRGVALAQVKNRVFWALFCHFGHFLAILGDFD